MRETESVKESESGGQACLCESWGSERVGGVGRAKGQKCVRE